MGASTVIRRQPGAVNGVIVMHQDVDNGGSSRHCPNLDTNQRGAKGVYRRCAFPLSDWGPIACLLDTLLRRQWRSAAYPVTPYSPLARNHLPVWL